MAIRTKRWTRSPRGRLFGVVTGLAEWRGLPSDTLRLVVGVITICTGIVPVAVIYLLLALILPEQREDDIIDYERWERNSYNPFHKRYADDASFRDRRDEDIEEEYERMKKKKESSYDKERDWDNRFKEDN